MRSISKKNEKGIALLLVIGSIVILTMIAVEFAYNAQIEYQMAVHQRERLQAYYLAHSAYNLTRLELKMGNAVQSQVQQATTQANISVPVDLSSPLCKQFPLKTSLFRLFLAGESTTPSEKEGGEGEEKKPSEAEASALAALPLQGVEEFLQFEGDFDSECEDEASKIDLNYIYTQDPTKKVEMGDNGYDGFKKLLIGVLNQSGNQELFKEEEVKITEVVRNMADWIDMNEVINDFGGAEGGGEDSVYRHNASGQITTKNGKLSIPEDIYMIEGVGDNWWPLVGDMFTIYGSTSQDGNLQINVCRASNEVVGMLILRYAETWPDLPPLKPEDGEILDQLVKTVKGGCTGAVPNKNKIGQDLDAKLLELLKAKSSEAPPPDRPTQTSAFAQWITTQSRFFSLKLSGQVQDTVVTLHAVIDLGVGGGSDVSKWKTLYWKVE